MSKGSLACIKFLQWALPRLQKRWVGYKKVRGQVCTRLNKRLAELGLDYQEYRNYLDDHPLEWQHLEVMTYITISRFFRDRNQWEALQKWILPELLQNMAQHQPLRVWSAGCASGEEPYSLSILWKHVFVSESNAPELEIIATDIQEKMLQRARQAVYTRSSSLKELPTKWQEGSFDKKGEIYHLKEKFLQPVQFLQQDILKEMPEGPFDLVFCKNLVAMYFDQAMASRIFRKITMRMNFGGYLILGNHESIALDEVPGLALVDKGINLYRKIPNHK